ncbi:putative bifunctional diguanylate cyclase/phosphodiesterase [Aliarcobacter butzleri]|uniref:putative bifunctional diguanylate cyclase/phosphodiesterase n=1 Tax=Aliarcobacter butzleri TaxID=28197 RepID=UPI0021B4C940|nr:EAL domain-containing protein [Aliarcobacter butzleri]MCT7557808.1 EAL domain-containing protein [Aliarcobacter butzleri]
MPKPKFLIVAEQSSVFKLYELLLNDYFSTVKTLLINDYDFIEEIDFNQVNIILIDLSGKKYLSTLNELSKKNLKGVKIILITPYDLNFFSQVLNNTMFFNLILSKPVDISRLQFFMKNECEKIEKRSILEKKNNILAKVVDLHPARIAVYTIDGVLFYSNTSYLQAYDLTLNHIDNLFFDDISQCNIGFATIKDKLQITNTFITQREENNRWFESTFYIISNEFIIHSCIDITAQKQKELQLEQSAIFFENSNEGIIITDSKAKIVSTNRAFSKITGYRQNEVIGKKTSILNSGIHDKNFFENMWESLKNHSTWQGEIWNKRKNGEIYPVWLSIAKALNPKYNEEFYIAIFTDISFLKEADKKIHFYANHDVLTKLANRVQFESHLKSTIESCKRRNSKIALFFVDLDKFKDVNDTYGHTVGDEMLKTVAKRLEQSIRKEDFIARLGGDEFVLIIKDVKNSEDIITLACKLNENIKEPITLDDKVFFMTLSIGISIFPDHGKDSEDLIKNSDAAMYVVKENGRNGYRLYSQDMTDKISLKVTIQNELKKAISKDEFEMYYQSVVDIKSNQIIGAEALVRWNHKNRGTLTPIHFINYIDEGGMSVEFGELVFKKVLHDIQIINSKLQNQDFKIAINIAPEYFFKSTFVDDVISYCKDFSINSKQIELELLETNIMKNSEISQKKIEKLHENGFDISIDDFGTGYSSLSYLKNFKVNKLKIDQSFIRDFLEDNSDKAIVQAIINLANIFNLKVQAEGIETKEHEKLLETLNCNLAQGYFYNKPMSLNKFIDLVINHPIKNSLND